MRQRIVVFLLPMLALVLTVSVKGQSSSQPTDSAAEEAEKKEAIEAQNKLIKALKTNDPVQIAPFYADDFLLTTERFGKGRVLTKSDLLKLKQSNQQTDSRNVHDNVVARVYGNTVVLTGHSTSLLHYRGKVSRGPRLFTFVWVRQDGRWKLVSGHVSDIPKGYETE